MVLGAQSLARPPSASIGCCDPCDPFRCGTPNPAQPKLLRSSSHVQPSHAEPSRAGPLAEASKAIVLGWDRARGAGAGAGLRGAPAIPPMRLGSARLDPSVCPPARRLARLSARARGHNPPLASSLLCPCGVGRSSGRKRASRNKNEARSEHCHLNSFVSF